MRLIPLPAGARRRTPEVARLIASLWLLGFVVMLGQSLLTPGGALLPKAARAAAMALAGGAFSVLLWRLVFVRWGSVGGRVMLLCASVLLVIGVHGALDVGTAAVLGIWADRAQRVLVVFDNPVRALFMSMLVETNIILFAVLHGVFGIAAMALRSSVETREREQLLSEARAATASAQLTMLRYQLNPHFVFNTLNAIGSLIDSNRNQQAGTMIEKLSEFLRSSLNATDETFSTLAEELATLEAYLDVEAVRFGDRLEVDYQVQSGLEHALVPSFGLQPVIENAIKHAVAPAMRKVVVRLCARAEKDMLIIAVEDDGAGESADHSARGRGTGVGLRNVRERLELLYGSAGTLSAGPTGSGYLAEIRLPLKFVEGEGAA